MDTETLRRIDSAAVALSRAKSVAVITGAGVSAESGVPTFRGKDGLWRTFRAEQLATPEAFGRDPTLVWEWYWWRRSRIAQAKPNPGHHALVALERRYERFCLLTQNVDGLHRDAGSEKLLEVHGNIWRAKCSREAGRVFDQRNDKLPDVSADGQLATSCELPRCSCGALLRPDVVWFGEPLDSNIMEQAARSVGTCDVLLVVGTSGVVYPVASLPALAKRFNATIIDINIEPTSLGVEPDIVLLGPSGTILPELERRL